jgi:hypothetical protein
MAHPLSTLGIVHTAISVLALVAAFVCLFKQGLIDPGSRFGKIYILLTVVTCLTGFPIMATGHIGPAHYLGILLLILLPLGIYAKHLPLLHKSWGYFQLIVMSTTLYLSFIPAINETLTRIPISHPVATGPGDPVMQQSLLILLLLFLVGVTYQVWKLRKRKQRVVVPN